MNAPTPLLNYQLLRLGAVLQLEQRARAATRAELEFLIVNDTTTAVPYQQAALWQQAPLDADALTLSGVADAERGGPYYAWLTRLIDAVALGARAAEPHAFGAADVTDALAREWSEWFPPHAFWCPLPRRADGRVDGLLGGLLLGRADPWQDADLQLLAPLAGAYAQSLQLHRQARGTSLRARWHGFARRRPAQIAAVAVALAALLPVRESVLAPAEIVPVDPAPVRAPFDGVVDALQVAPNQPVHAGQRLVSLDRTELQTRYAVTQKALDMAREQYADTAQQALSDDKAKSQLAILASKVDQQQAELAYDQDMLKRADMTAPVDGVAVFDDADEWIGKPVALGERIMLIASPQRMQLEIQVPAASVVSFAPGSEVVFFSNLAPDRPAYGKLTFASYASAAGADGVLSYAFRAAFDAGQPALQQLRLGLKGTAKIYGPRRMLALWLLRRPLALVREWLSL